MFVTISCSGLPDQSACTFTPENLEIPVGATAAINSSMVIATQATSLAKAEPGSLRGSRPVAWAILLPGALILGGFAFGARRRRFLSRLVLLGLVAFVTILGTAACSPLYNYYNHGPPYNRPTPAGSLQRNHFSAIEQRRDGDNSHHDHRSNGDTVARSWLRRVDVDGNSAQGMISKKASGCIHLMRPKL